MFCVRRGKLPSINFFKQIKDISLSVVVVVVVVVVITLLLLRLL